MGKFNERQRTRHPITRPTKWVLIGLLVLAINGRIMALDEDAPVKVDEIDQEKKDEGSEQVADADADADAPVELNNEPPGIDVEKLRTDDLYESETPHEEMGQAHWPAVVFSDYVSNPVYSSPEKYTEFGLRPVYNFTHFLFQNTLTNEPALPPGYIVVKGEDALELGPKFQENDWRDLLWDYTLLLLWVGFLLALIIIIPFIAVLYCCFCCCRRCPQSCPPCDSKRDAKLRCMCGMLLLLLILLILLGTVIAFLANKSLDEGTAKSSNSLRRIAEDICTFLKDIKNHIYHLLSRNYEEMMNHVIALLNEADTHIFMDLGNASESNALEELERIFKNMPQAHKLMMEVSALVKEWIFLNSQLRDAIRGMKRDILYACTLCSHWKCKNFLRFDWLMTIDTMKCLHLDLLPDSVKIAESMHEVVEQKRDAMIRDALLRLQDIKDVIVAEMDVLAPAIIKDLEKGRDTMLNQAAIIGIIIEEVVSDIFFSATRITRSLEQLYKEYAVNRSRINFIACVILAVIIFLSLAALILGCCISKRTAAFCLLLVILLIFCVLSFLTLIGLFYFMLGLITYQGACVPTRDQQKIELFRQLDAAIDVPHYMSHLSDQADKDKETGPLPMSYAMESCGEDQSIFDVLLENNVYDIRDLASIKILSTAGTNAFVQPFVNLTLLTVEEKSDIIKTYSGTLAPYHSVNYLKHMCTQLTSTPLILLASKMRNLSSELLTNWGGHHHTRQALLDAAAMLELYHKEYVLKIDAVQDAMKPKLSEIDDLILYNNHNFGDSIHVLLEAVVRSEEFIISRGDQFMEELLDNLTRYVNFQIDDYFEMVIDETNTEVGRCKPLAYIYDRGVDHICRHLIDPINGYWVGILLCSLLFLPLLFVAHRLMCLYKIYSPPMTQVNQFHCPICMGAPIVPDLVPGQGNRFLAGRNDGDFIILTDQLESESNVLEVKESQTSNNKRKQE
ncbi:prominin-like protein [Drosophila grimshawi]|uniref:prominin-like protein n=1 Tax=Drosophila grimshawi TaxID=7222 RepID=UPI000C871675|nr:prominin-like protein [Drosophila grimshawi]